MNDGARSRAIGETKQFSYCCHLVAGEIVLKYTIDELSQCGYWQVGNGLHASERREIHGFVTFQLRPDKMTAFQYVTWQLKVRHNRI